MIRNNLPYKLLAIVVTFALWFYVNAERNPRARKPFNVPIEVRNLAREYSAELSVGDATVTIDGLKSRVDTISREHVSAWVDCKDIVPGQTVTQDRLKVHTRVLDMSPDEVDITLAPKAVNVRIEALRTRRLPVEVRMLTAAPLGYSYGLPTIEPASVGISGKITQVMKVRRLLLPVSGDDPDQPIDGSYAVVPVDAKGMTVPGIILDHEKVRLKLDMIEVLAPKTVMVSWNVAGQPKFPARVTGVDVSPSSVVLKGKPKVLMSISTVDTDSVSVDGADDTVTRDVYLRVPTGVTVVGSRKVRITVKIEGSQAPTH